MDATTWTALGGAATALGILVPAVHRFVYKPVRRGVDGLVATHDIVHQQLRANSGSSLVDKVAALGRDLSEMKDQQQRNGERIESIDDRTADTNATLKRQVGRTDQIFDLIERPLFEGDAEGRITRANEALCRALGVTTSQLLGMGWVSLLTLVERSTVQKELTDAASAKRMYRVLVTFEVGSKTIRAVMIAQPVVDGAEVLGYQGALEVLKVTEVAPS